MSNVKSSLVGKIARKAARATDRAGQTLSRSARSSRARIKLKAAGLEHGASIHSFTTRAELEALLSLAEAMPEGGTLLEIGSYVGASTCFLAAGAFGKGVKIWCVDTWQNETMPDGVRDTYSEFKDNLRSVEKDLVLVRKNSNELSASDLPGAVDLAFIDGDHSYKAARHDFSLVSPLVKKGGVVAFHDVTWFQGVSRVLGEAMSTGEWRLEGFENNLAWIRKGDFLHGDVPNV